MDETQTKSSLPVFDVTDNQTLADWVGAHRDRVFEALYRSGAVLFRGFDVTTAQEFERYSNAVYRELYTENSEHVPEGPDTSVQTPVFYPNELKLLWHNENSFNFSWPTLISFGCAIPATTGGETPLVDSRAVYQAIEPDVRARFESLGIRYVRHYGDGLGLDWQRVFKTDDRALVEEKCRASRMEWTWLDGDRLRTIANRPATVRHPVTGEASWFNQALHWHISCVDAETREALLDLYPEDELPRNCYYGNGTPIPDEVIHQIHQVHTSLEQATPWQRGDVRLVDNILMAHARNPYTGQRKILVSMGDLLNYETVTLGQV